MGSHSRARKGSFRWCRICQLQSTKCSRLIVTQSQVGALSWFQSGLHPLTEPSRYSATLLVGDCFRERYSRSWPNRKPPRYASSIRRRSTPCVFANLYSCPRLERRAIKARRSSQVLRRCRCFTFRWLN